jgi:hypothetical protein
LGTFGRVIHTAGAFECLAVELCEPCLHLQQLTRPGIIKELIHRTGLNADILNDGASRWVTPSSSMGSPERPTIGTKAVGRRRGICS